MSQKQHTPPQDQIDYWLKASSDVKILPKSAKKEPENTPLVLQIQTQRLATYSTTFDKHRSLNDLVLNSRSGTDLNTTKKMDQGKLMIDSKIDLHGYNLEAAFTMLEQFLLDNVRQSNRMLLIVTGKGSPSQAPTIKSSLITWLNYKRIRPYIVRVSTAQNKHGGHGAFYVLLRKVDRA